MAPSSSPAAPPTGRDPAALPSKEQLAADYRRAAAAAAAAGSLHREVADAQAKDILFVVLALRWALALAVRTFFQPDEYFQALEPAWQLAHGPASGAWITWEWKHRLRTSLHPVLFAGVYAALEGVLGLMHLVGPLRAHVLVAAPGLVQASLTALADYYVWRLACELYGRGRNAAWAALWLTLASPWQVFCGARTFSNGLEATLTIAALAYWPWQLLAGDAAAQSSRDLFPAGAGAVRRLRLSLVLAATAVVLRPTNLLVWLALLTVTVTRLTLDAGAAAAASSSSFSPFLRAGVVGRLLAEALGCGSLVLGLAALSDRLFYGAWTLPAYTFLDVNVKRDVAVFYGRSPWHYYLSQGLPLLTTTALPFVLYALYASLAAAAAAAAAAGPAKKAETAADGTTVDPVRTANARRALAFTALATVAALSLVDHKEVRFLHPLLPILLVLAAPHVAAFFSTPATPSTGGSTATTTLRRKRLLWAALAANAALAAFLSFFHQPAPLGVLAFLRGEYERIHHDWLEMPASALPAYDVYPDAFLSAAAAAATPTTSSDGDGDELFALFLTPCHSTPWRSHLVYPGLRARALTCEPPLDTAPRSAARAAYRDEADRFYDDPPRFLATELWPRRASGRHGGEVPRYLVGFEGIEGMLNAYFASADAATGGAGLGVQTPLRRVWVGWNGLFNEDWRRTGALVVWDTGVFSNASHPDAERTYEELWY